MTSRILGVDPGLSETGWAVLEGLRTDELRLVASGCIRTPAGAPLPGRLDHIHGGVAGVLREFTPGQMAVEEMFFMKSANSIRATLQARGVVLLSAAQSGTPVVEYNPRQVKISLTGSGSASKVQMQRMTQAALRLKDRLRPDDVADAAAIALCHFRSRRVKNFKVLDRVGGRKVGFQIGNIIY